jgi:hypothetical protein
MTSAVGLFAPRVARAQRDPCGQRAAHGSGREPHALETRDKERSVVEKPLHEIHFKQTLLFDNPNS